MKEDKKKAIIETTVRLIKEKGSNPADVTVRDICREAGVGISNINYYFQSKDQLIEQCVQFIIGDVIGQHSMILLQCPSTSAVDRLKYTANATVSYLYANENISRISILTDLMKGRQGDNTEQTLASYLPLVEAACIEKKSDADAKLITMRLILFLQSAFLRTERIREELGIDLRNENKRKDFVENYMDSLLQ